MGKRSLGNGGIKDMTINKNIRVIAVFIVMIFLFVGCGSQITEFKVASDKTITVNQTYDAGVVKYTIEKIHILKSANVKSEGHFDLIQIDSYAQITQDDIYWTPINSTMTINGNEKTVPMYIDENLNLPLQKNDKLSLRLVAYITETTVDKIQSITWHITQPVIKDSYGNWWPRGSTIDVNAIIKKGE
jgi:hypothetical protein